MEEDTYNETDCYECGHILSEADIERDVYPNCGTPYHDVLEDDE